MHEPENGVNNPQMFTTPIDRAIPPKLIAPKIEQAIGDSTINLREKGEKNVGLLDSYNNLLAQASVPEGKLRGPNLKLDPDVRFFLNSFDAALADLSDELAVRTQEEALKKEGKKLDIDSRTEHAVVNQKFAQALYSAAKAPKGDIQRRNATTFFNTMNELKDTGLGSFAIRELNNARAQAAVMIAFENAGYSVLVPDPENFDEVRDMDVLAMADLVAISPDGQVNFVDVKGLLRDQNGQLISGVSSRDRQIFDNNAEVNERKRASAQLMKRISEMGYNMGYNKEPRRIEITVPTDVAQISALGEILNPNIGMDVVRSVRR